MPRFNRFSRVSILDEACRASNAARFACRVTKRSKKQKVENSPNFQKFGTKFQDTDLFIFRFFRVFALTSAAAWEGEKSPPIPAELAGERAALSPPWGAAPGAF